MQYDNDAKQMKFEVLRKVAQLAYLGELEENLEGIPYDIIPGFAAVFIGNVRSFGNGWPWREAKIFLDMKKWKGWSLYCRLPARAARSTDLR